MSEAHRRRKQPAEVRRAALEATAMTCLRTGVAGLTLDAVAREAGISKGGLLHHFPTKQALLEGLTDAMFEDFARRLDAEMAGDPVECGRFTRAYVRVSSAGSPECPECGVLAIVMMADASIRKRWSGWLDGRIALCGPSDHTPPAVAARLAADGIWLSRVAGGGAPSAEVLAVLDAMTRP